MRNSFSALFLCYRTDCFLRMKKLICSETILSSFCLWNLTIIWIRKGDSWLTTALFDLIEYSIINTEEGTKAHCHYCCFLHTLKRRGFCLQANSKCSKKPIVQVFLTRRALHEKSGVKRSVVSEAHLTVCMIQRLKMNE